MKKLATTLILGTLLYFTNAQRWDDYDGDRDMSPDWDDGDDWDGDWRDDWDMPPEDWDVYGRRPERVMAAPAMEKPVQSQLRKVTQTQKLPMQRQDAVAQAYQAQTREH
jgi:hypothetical protein